MKRLKIKKIVIVFFVALMFSAPGMVLAAVVLEPCPMAPEGLVACQPTGTPACVCNFCHVLATVHNIMQFLMFQIAVPLAALLFVLAGLMLLISGANPNWRTTGKKMFTATVVGVVIVFLAWVIVNTVINTLAGPAPDAFPWPWNKPTC